MNDFTKAELEFIWQKLAIANYDNTGMQDLPNKVCSMIDNYCEHEDTYHCDYCGIVSCEDCREPCGGELIDE
jgi:hypothetical protein